MHPDTERLIRNELNYRRVRRAPVWAALLMALGLFVPFFGFWIFGAVLRLFGLQ